MSDSLPFRLLCPWDSPGKNTGVGCHFLLQGDLPNPGIEPGSPALQADSLPTEVHGRDWLWAKLGLALVGRAMFSKSLIQFSADGWGCIPSL